MSADVHEGQLPSDRMMEYDYAMGQDCLASGQYEDAVIYFRKAARLGAPEAASEIGMLGGKKFERGVLGPPDRKKSVFYAMKSVWNFMMSILCCSWENSLCMAFRDIGPIYERPEDCWKKLLKKETGKRQPCCTYV